MTQDDSRPFPNLNDISQLFILGDSYSDIGWVYPNCPLPTADNPLGIDHPADWVTWATRSGWQDNWVQHMSRDRQANQHHLEIYDSAKGGSFVADVETQVRQLADLFEESDCKLSADKAVIVLWVGINDVSGLSHTLVGGAMDVIDDILSRCYKLGFRNLLLVDVPPRKPVKPGAKASSIYKVIANNIEEWNEALEEQWVSWTERPGTTGAIFSSYDVFEKILTNPTQYSFRPTDPYTPNGGIWYDHLHPTTKVHEILYTALKEEWLSGKIGLGGGG